ncbi:MULTISPECIES: flagellar biosynthesis protein FlhA [Vibrio]|uniref:Flagellar biosynthesis protein FlhA n=1 Tax=Vibrio diazotrophicus TaxID=685 RepID=A0A329E045_VIBDI|nr:flagellar biosynthesis protein FlhA [Vibrio diazotrophicus]PNI00117.1 flagellar biosynthesis protein FlhA [Vibrio diazotrophicus]RAS57026.1 flagellar biosynthesis protein FlhA [Vibrio diazotrophicus]
MLKGLQIFNSKLAIPLVLLMILAMVILPLPALLLDGFFTFNIMLAIVVLLVSSTVKRILDFSVFPSLLLIATLLRLTLNVASTRIVLLEGHNGGDAAGKVIQSFGEVVIGGSYVVGIVVFVILMIINFVVITKGGERISEVSARFTLDALPGKQMAIDADLNSGNIDQEQARARRKEVGDEAEFYGAMDGASKFVRGDAVAGLMILFINLIGGVLIGMFEHGLTVSEAFQTYALLTIGDGLVAQIPSLLLAVSAAIIVTRISDNENDMAEVINKQILASPSVLYMTAGVMFIIGSVPNMPHLAFYSFSVTVGFVAWRQSKKDEGVDLSKAEVEAPLEKTSLKDHPLDWSIIPAVDAIALRLGFKLVPLVTNKEQNSLLKSIRGCRKTLSEQIGFVIPEVVIRDDLALKPAEYVIFVDGDEIERGEVYPDMLMAVGPGVTSANIDGTLGVDPAYRLPALWVSKEDKTKAINLGFQVIDIHDVIATHVSKVCTEHLDGIFNYDDVKALNKRLSYEHPELAESLSNTLTPNLQMMVIRQLLAEQVPIINIRTIANTLIESGDKIKDPILLSSNIRVALKRTILNLVSPNSKALNVFTLGGQVEQDIKAGITLAQQNDPNTPLDGVPLAPELLQKFQNRMPSIVQTMQAQGMTPVLLVTPMARPIVSKLARAFAKGLIILSFNEIPNEYQINPLGQID